MEDETKRRWLHLVNHPRTFTPENVNVIKASKAVITFTFEICDCVLNTWPPVALPREYIYRKPWKYYDIQGDTSWKWSIDYWEPEPLGTVGCGVEVYSITANVLIKRKSGTSDIKEYLVSFPRIVI